MHHWQSTWNIRQVNVSLAFCGCYLPCLSHTPTYQPPPFLEFPSVIPVFVDTPASVTHLASHFLLALHSSHGRTNTSLAKFMCLCIYREKFSPFYSPESSQAHTYTNVYIYDQKNKKKNCTLGNVERKPKKQNEKAVAPSWKNLEDTWLKGLSHAWSIIKYYFDWQEQRTCLDSRVEKKKDWYNICMVKTQPYKEILFFIFPYYSAFWWKKGLHLLLKYNIHCNIFQEWAYSTVTENLLRWHLL